MHELFLSLSGGQFEPVCGGQFEPELSGQFKPVFGGQFHRFLHRRQLMRRKSRVSHFFILLSCKKTYNLITSKYSFSFINVSISL